MGFVLGPILRRLDLSVRRGIVMQLTPKDAVPDADGFHHRGNHRLVSGGAAWLHRSSPGRPIGWVAAALTLVTLMTILGLGFLTPVNVWVCLELQKREPI
jgi:hypothetical protein